MKGYSALVGEDLTCFFTSVSMSFGKITKLFPHTERARRLVRCQDSGARQIALITDFENPVLGAEKVPARRMKRTVEAAWAVGFRDA